MDDISTLLFDSSFSGAVSMLVPAVAGIAAGALLLQYVNDIAPYLVPAAQRKSLLTATTGMIYVQYM